MLTVLNGRHDQVERGVLTTHHFTNNVDVGMVDDERWVVCGVYS